MFRNILVANDGSAGAQSAFNAAIDAALKYGAALHMICIEEIPYFPATMDEVREETAEAGQRFAALIQRSRELAAAKGLALETHVLPGHPVTTIVEFLRTHSFDLLVVGFMGHSALYNRLIGSTTDRLVDHAPCAVLVVK